jgi:hypothetical protein
VTEQPFVGGLMIVEADHDAMLHRLKP